MATVARLLREGQRVLVLGGVTDAALRALRDRGREVLVREWEEEPQDPSEASLADTARVSALDAVVATDTLAGLPDPVLALAAASRRLRPGGYLVACLPAAPRDDRHVSPGEGPIAPGAGPIPTPGELATFSWASAVALLEDSGFAIARVEWGVRTLPSVAADPAAPTAWFVVVAYPLPAPGLDWVRGDLRELAEAREAAAREAAALRARLASLEPEMDRLRDVARAASSRAEAVQKQLLATHDLLARRDSELLAMLRAFDARRDALETAQRQLTEERDALETALRQLTEERDALRAHLVRIRESLPGRVYRVVRPILSWGARQFIRARGGHRCRDVR